MDIIVYIIFGILGLLCGYKIPEISLTIMEYKKGKDNFNISYDFLFSKIFKLSCCIINGAAWVFSILYMNNALIAFLVGIQITLGLIIAFIDINIRIIPNELVIAMMILGLIFQTIKYGLIALMSSIICMVVMMTIFISVAGFVGLGKVGAGDVKLVGAMGLALGPHLIIIAVGSMAIVLLMYIVVGMILKKVYLSTMLPLAPFIISGYIVALLSMNFF